MVIKPLAQHIANNLAETLAERRLAEVSARSTIVITSVLCCWRAGTAIPDPCCFVRRQRTKMMTSAYTAPLRTTPARRAPTLELLQHTHLGVRVTFLRRGPEATARARLPSHRGGNLRCPTRTRTTQRCQIYCAASHLQAEQLCPPLMHARTHALTMSGRATTASLPHASISQQIRARCVRLLGGHSAEWPSRRLAECGRPSASVVSDR
jgi:hypothetical protein